MFGKAKSLGKSLLIASGAIVFSVGIYAVTAEFIGPGVKWSTDADRPLGATINLLAGVNADQIEITNDCSSSTAEICLDADDNYNMDSSNVVANASGSVIERLEWIMANKVDDKNCQAGAVTGVTTDFDSDAVTYDIDYTLNGATQTGTYINALAHGQETYTASLSCEQKVVSVSNENVVISCDGGFHEENDQCVFNITCGDTIEYEWQTYNTVEIGTQCWFAENLNVGTKFRNWWYEPYNNTIIEKWCYEDSDANCDTYGGLYSWDEAMWYTNIEWSRGICSAGWHIPTDAEWHTLESYLATGSCDGDRQWYDCDPVGQALKAGGSSGFEALLWWQRVPFGAKYLFKDTLGWFISSTEYESDLSEYWYYTLHDSNTTIARGYEGKEDWRSIRCLADIIITDTTPDSFSFSDKRGVELATLTESDIIQITGIDTPSAVTVTGDGSPQFRICSDVDCSTEVQTWGNAEQTITNNQYLQLRLTSGAVAGTEFTATVTVGEVASSWDVTDNALAVEDVFSTYLYEGNGVAWRIFTSNINLKDFGWLIWTKSRNNTRSHQLWDTKRTNRNTLSTNTISAQLQQSNIVATANGYEIISHASAEVNYSGEDYVSWTFRQAPRFFDVVTYTGDGESGRELSHALGIKPGMVIVKRTDNTGYWWVQHRGSPNMGAAYPEMGGNLYLNATDSADIGTNPLLSAWSDSSVTISSNQSGNMNADGATYVAYVFAHDESEDGIIHTGSFTEPSGSTEIALGWEPQFIIAKPAGSTGNWFMFDSMRGWPIPISGNVGGAQSLLANSSSVEGTSAIVTPTSDGFKFDTIYGAGVEWVYMAIRKAPMKQPTSGEQVYNTLTKSNGQVTTNIDGLGFSPDMALMHSSSTLSHLIFDKLRGADIKLATDNTSAEAGIAGTILNAFRMDWIRWGDYSWYYNGTNHFFKRAPGVFDMVAYTADGVDGKTIKHNLGVKPEMIWFKRRSNTGNWTTYFNMNNDSHDYMMLNGDSGSSGAHSYSSLNLKSEPTDESVIVGNDSRTNWAAGDTYVAYMFASLPGVSKVGSYIGTATDQTIDCAFTDGARFVLIKRTDATGDWYLWDSARGITAGNDPYLLLNTTGAEVTTTDYIDPDNTGFVVTSSAPAALNAVGGEYIFLAFD